MLKSKQGFTLIEMLLVIGLAGVLGSVGFYVAMDQYRSYALSADRNTVASMLQKARSKAMNNINESNFGFTIQGSDYVLFQGSSYVTRNAAYDQAVKRSPVIDASGTLEFTFKQLTGELLGAAGDLNLSNTSKTLTISVNNEGRISW